MKYKTEEEQATRVNLIASKDVSHIPEGTVFVFMNGKLVPMQSSNSVHTKERSVEKVPCETTDDDGDISVRSNFVHFFKVASDSKPQPHSQEEVDNRSELSGKLWSHARSQSKDKEKGKLHSVISLDEDERFEFE